MKNLLICLLFLSSMTVGAQGIWTMHNTDGDELKEIPAGKYAKYTVDSLGCVIIRDFNDWNLEIETFKGTFCGNFSTSSGGWKVPYIEIRMGLYDANGKLLDKTFKMIEADDNTGFRSAHTSEHWITMPQERAKFKKMIKGMYDGDGYVRILVKRMNMTDWDMKITPFNKQ